MYHFSSKSSLGLLIQGLIQIFIYCNTHPKVKLGTWGTACFFFRPWFAKYNVFYIHQICGSTIGARVWDWMSWRQLKLLSVLDVNSVRYWLLLNRGSKGFLTTLEKPSTSVHQSINRNIQIVYQIVATEITVTQWQRMNSIHHCRQK